MSLSVRSDMRPDIRDLIRRSPFSGDPEAGEILKECLWRSQRVQYGMVDGKVACVWGAIPATVLSESAYLWLLTTDLVTEHKFMFVRNVQIYVEEMLKEYPVLHGDVGDRRAERWLRWCGAEISGGRFVIRRR